MGRPVYLNQARANILLFLMAYPGRHFSVAEVVEGAYWYREDGGPETAPGVVATNVHRTIELFHYNGLDLMLKNPETQQGYMFRGVKLIQPPARSRVLRLDNFTDVCAGRVSAL